MLANLKSALYEERELTRRAAHEAHRTHGGRKAPPRFRREKDGGAYVVDAAAIVDARSARLIADTVKELCRRFRDIERPFLRSDAEVVGPNGEHFSGGREYGLYEFGGFEGDYRAVTLAHRFTWLRRRGSVVALMEALERMQVRRIGFEVRGLQRYVYGPV